MPVLVLRMVEEQFHRDADDDRPVREGRTPAEHLRDGEIEYRSCPYAGSRIGEPMNVSALRQMGARWDDIVGALAFLRDAYRSARGAYGPDLMDVWRVSQLGSALPWFSILRAPDARAPAYAAALSKITLGTGIMTQRLYVQQLSDRALPAPLTPAGLLAGAEATGTLIGETEVCSAPDKMILRFLDGFFEPVGAAAGPIAGLAGARDAMLGFGAHYIALKHVLWLSFLARRFLYADLAAALGPRPELQELIDAPCEPPDFFTVGPGDMAAISLAHRAQWLRSLAELLVPLAPDGSDLALCEAARAIAAAMGEAPARGTLLLRTRRSLLRADRRSIDRRRAPEHDEAAAELQATLGADPGAARLAARALATFGTIDALLGGVIAGVEAGFRRALGMTPGAARISTAVRDRLVARSPRALFGSLAPRTFPRLCLP